MNQKPSLTKPPENNPSQVNLSTHLPPRNHVANNSIHEEQSNDLPLQPMDLDVTRTENNEDVCCPLRSQWKLCDCLPVTRADLASVLLLVAFWLVIVFIVTVLNAEGRELVADRQVGDRGKPEVQRSGERHDVPLRSLVSGHGHHVGPEINFDI